MLVVAADEGVKPQTKEAIRILEEAKTPFVVAFNKIDRIRAANFEKAKTDLMNAGVLLEGYGGQVGFQGVSAKTGEGVSDLLDLLSLPRTSKPDLRSVRARAGYPVLEARRDPRRGIEATAWGRTGRCAAAIEIATPTAHGKVKILRFFGKDRAVPGAVRAGGHYRF